MSLNNFSPEEKQNIVRSIFAEEEIVYNVFFERGDDSFKNLKLSEIKAILSILKSSRSMAYPLSGKKQVLVDLLTSIGFVGPINTSPQPQPPQPPPSPTPPGLFQEELQPHSFLELDLGITVELDNLLGEN
ncbi:hypothetical protein DDB_G0272664 [Dictyostelium discoideum AX4]|uniref:SAP domain-containing protein n=1 Tax=Dictyostelium discoideum TaxID=44689 RepID=Q86A35_DICDI|nr:hypothetical protein DDB_G0272664 [Dictyostelium discoideum AX4]EAL70969.1 hypothetical protein DDB_G0272664 [Dictyostelium discoideum AX4]|eukprot:XP_644997.1 hypothetical protein DDB_G0272664 [Dictyostelium discoideum AX4]